MSETKNLFTNLKPEERFKAMQEIATSTTSEKVRRYYSDEEKAQHKDFIVDENTSLMDKEAEFSEIKKQFNKTISEYKGQIKTALTDLKRGYSENEEQVFLIDDQDAGLMNVYDEKGVFLYARKLHPEEKQARILTVTKTGTEG